MQTTSLSVPWAGNRAFVRVLYALWSWVYDWSIVRDRAMLGRAARKIARWRLENVAVLREMARVLTPGGRLGLFLAQGEVAPLFSSREELQECLPDAGFSGVEIEDRDDVYRIVTAVKGPRGTDRSAAARRNAEASSEAGT